jgi:hypothetical protein
LATIGYQPPGPLCFWCKSKSCSCATEEAAKGCVLFRARGYVDIVPIPSVEDNDDTIVQPAHYSRWPMQAIEFIAVNNLDYMRGNVIKYIIRYDAKNGLEDLRKARSYLNMLIRKEEGIDRWWEKPVSDERKANAK